jgi:hypothetical protein
MIVFNKEKINETIACSYFMLGVKKTNFSFNKKTKISQLSIESLKLYNVKISGKKE